MKELYFYVGKHYLRFFIILFGALILFFVGFDYMQNVKDLSDSANIHLLYLVFKTFYAMDILMPISLIFAFIATSLYLIRSNGLVALYSLGYSKRAVLGVYITLASILTIIYIALHITPFAYSYERALSIKKYGNLKDSTQQLFFKYDSGDKRYYIYMGYLSLLEQKAYDLRLFEVEEDKLKVLLEADEATYNNRHWKIDKASLIEAPILLKERTSHISLEEKNDIFILEGFRPSILDKVYEARISFSIMDAVYALKLLSSQGVNTDKIKSALSAMIIYPFFALFTIIFLFGYVPLSSRQGNLSLFTFSSILGSLLLWGMLFSFLKLTLSGTLSATVGIILPVIIIVVISILSTRRIKLL